MSQDLFLAIDVGNTNTSFGLFRGRELFRSYRFKTDRGRTSDEMGALLQVTCARDKIRLRAIKGCIVASVVPPLRFEIESLARDHLGCEPIFVEPGTKSGIKILYENPHDVGADRIVNAVATVELYGSPGIAVDFGTATTFDCIDGANQYLGGVIAPGIEISSEALFMKAARLPRVLPARPEAIIGRNTVESIQSGLFYGYAGLVDGILKRLVQEIKGEPVVVATGWLGRLICQEVPLVKHFDADLTLQGLAILFEMNRPRPKR